MKTFNEACDLYLATKQAEQRLSLDTNNKVEEFRKLFGNLAITEVTTDVVTVRTATRFSKLKPNSRRRWLNILSAILVMAGDTWGIPVPRVKRPSVDDARDAHFDHKEVRHFFNTLYASSYQYYYPHFSTLVYTGVRLGELLRLQRSDFKDDYVQVRKLNSVGKTISRQIPLSSQVRSILPSLGAVHAFEKSPDVLFKNPNEASLLFNSIMRDICGQMGHEVLRVHDLRHTFAFLAAQNGADIGDLQLLMGHKDISQTMRYRGYVPSRAVKAVASL